MADKLDKTAAAAVVKQHWTKRRLVLTIVIVLMVSAVAGAIALKMVNNANQRKEAAAKQVKTLQQNLQTTMKNANSQGVIDTVTSLLAGHNNKTFVLSNTQLSTYYLDRANSYLNLKQYKNAVSDYEQAIPLDSNNKAAALQGEIEARYNLGDRQQLIPLYQQIISITSNSQNPRRASSIVQYKDNIQTLQQNGELHF